MVYIELPRSVGEGFTRVWIIPAPREHLTALIYIGFEWVRALIDREFSLRHQSRLNAVANLQLLQNVGHIVFDRFFL